MNLNQDLSAWTFSTVRDLVASSEYEPGNFDFKEAVTGRDPDLAESIRKTACAMANTDGGFLIFGVKDRGRCKAGEDRIVGIELRPEMDLAKQFGDQVQHVGPPIRFDRTLQPIRLSGDQARGLFVVRIDRSPAGPHQYGGIFYKRGDGGACQHMDAHEVRNHMLLSEERLRKVALLRLELRDVVETSKAMHRGTGGDAEVVFDRFDVSTLKQLIVDTCAALPTEPRLLPDLHTISRLARHANETLQQRTDRALGRLGDGTFLGERDPGGRRQRHVLSLAADSDRAEIVKLCQACEETLAAHFGPLSGA